MPLIVDRAAQARDEDQFYEIEVLLLYISEAMDRSVKARKELLKLEAPPHLVAAVEETQAALRADFKKLVQSTHFAPPKQAQDRLVA